MKTLIDILLKTDIQGKLYYENKKVQAEKKITDVKHQKFETRTTRVYGVNTDSKTRPQMIDILRVIINEEYDILNSKRLIDNIAGLEYKKSSKVEHSDNSHDDLLFAYLMIRYIWTYGTNLAKFYIYKNKRDKSEDDDYVETDNYISSFLQIANFNKQEANARRNEFTSQQIINEYYERKTYEEQKRGYEDRNSQAIANIFRLNSK